MKRFLLLPLLALLLSPLATKAQSSGTQSTFIITPKKMRDKMVARPVIIALPELDKDLLKALEKEEKDHPGAVEDYTNYINSLIATVTENKDVFNDYFPKGVEKIIPISEVEAQFKKKAKTHTIIVFDEMPRSGMLLLRIHLSEDKKQRMPIFGIPFINYLARKDWSFSPMDFEMTMGLFKSNFDAIGKSRKEILAASMGGCQIEGKTLLLDEKLLHEDFDAKLCTMPFEVVSTERAERAWNDKEEGVLVMATFPYLRVTSQIIPGGMAIGGMVTAFASTSKDYYGDAAFDPISRNIGAMGGVKMGLLGFNKEMRSIYLHHESINQIPKVCEKFE